MVETGGFVDGTLEAIEPGVEESQRLAPPRPTSTQSRMMALDTDGSFNHDQIAEALQAAEAVKRTPIPAACVHIKRRLSKRFRKDRDLAIEPAPASRALVCEGTQLHSSPKGLAGEHDV